MEERERETYILSYIEYERLFISASETVILVMEMLLGFYCNRFV